MPLFGRSGGDRALTDLINQWGNSLLQGVADLQAEIQRARHDTRNLHQVVTGLHYQLERSHQRICGMADHPIRDFVDLVLLASTTAAVLRAQIEKLDELRAQISEPVVQAQIDNITAALTERAHLLGALEPQKGNEQ